MKILKRTLGQVKLPRKLSTKRIERIVKKVLTAEKVRRPGDVNIIFVDGRNIRKINKNFLRHDYLTDVIAFPYDAIPGDPATPPFGDVYICVSVAKANAKQFGVSLEQECTRLIVHGLLHILGYDDHRPKDKKKMWSRQEKYVHELCLKRRS